MTTYCLQCGNEITKDNRPNRLRKYCSRKCHASSLIGKQASIETRKKLSMAKKGIPKREETKKKMSEAQKGNKKSLGAHHTIETRRILSEAKIGKNNPNWRGGVSKIYGEKRNRAYHSLEYKLWREKVFIRDNYTCQKCYKKGGRLQAHHLVGWIKEPRLRYEVKNGMTLDYACHKEIHKMKRKLNRKYLT